MKYIKITNYNKANGTCDYKGLNIDLFIAGKQYYPSGKNECLIVTSEENIPQNSDIQVITETEYNTYIQEDSKNKPVTVEDRISALEVAMANTLGM